MVRGLTRRWLTSRSVKKRCKVGAIALISLSPAVTARAGQRPVPAVLVPPTGTSRLSAGRGAPSRSPGPAAGLRRPDRQHSAGPVDVGAGEPDRFPDPQTGGGQ